MVKIGILTQPLGLNYGGILQAFALQQALSQLEVQSVILDRHRSKARELVSLLWGWSNYIIGNRPKARMWPNKEELSIICQHTDQFIKKYIPSSPKLSSTSQLKHYCKREDISTFIVGSDQVWRKQYSICLPNFFLDFVSNDSSVTKLAYAASFGIDTWEYNKKETTYYKELLQQFDGVSVREESAVGLCKDHFNIEAQHVLDPTMLLNQEIYNHLISEYPTEPISGDLFCYMLDRTPSKMKLVSNFATDNNLSPFELLPSKKFQEIKSNEELNECIIPPVEQWVRNIRDSKFIITDSFHGTVFSIIFNKPFICLINIDRGSTRFDSLLRHVSPLLEDQFNTIKIKEKGYKAYQGENNVFKNMKKRSVDFLHSQLMNIQE